LGDGVAHALAGTARGLSNGLGEMERAYGGVCGDERWWALPLLALTALLVSAQSLAPGHENPPEGYP
jgi:hypothetical protein